MWEYLIKPFVLPYLIDSKGVMEQKKLIKISQKTNGRCFYCNRDGEHIDHFVSKKKWIEWDLTKRLGSVNNVTNLFLSCAKCNHSKSDKCPEDFIGNSFKCWDRYDRANKRINYIEL